MVGSSSSRTSGRFSSCAARPRETTWPPLRVCRRRSSGDVAEAEPVQLGAGALLDVPVVADRGEVLLARVAGLDGVQRRDAGGDAQHLGDGQVAGQRQVLRQVAEHPVDGDAAAGGRAARRRSAGAAWSCRRRSARPGRCGRRRTVKDRSAKTGVSSGQEKDRLEQTMNASDMGGTSRVRWARAGAARRDGISGTTARPGRRCCRAPAAAGHPVSPGDVVVTRHVWSPRHDRPSHPAVTIRGPVDAHPNSARGRHRTLSPPSEGAARGVRPAHPWGRPGRRLTVGSGPAGVSRRRPVRRRGRGRRSPPRARAGRGGCGRAG